MLKLEAYLQENYGELVELFKNRKFPAPDADMLPPIGALIRSHDGALIAAGFLIRTDTKACVIGNLVTNPTSSGTDRNEALDLILRELTLEAKERGFRLVCVSTNLQKVMDRFERHEFTKADENVTYFGKEI
jgi:hypothetical protein